MSHTLHETINVPEAGIGTATFPTHDSILNCPRRIGVRPYPPLSALTQETQGGHNFIDGSGPIFSMYSEMASEEDTKMAESWKADADRVFLFVSVFLPYRTSHPFKGHRPVYSLLSSRP